MDAVLTPAACKYVDIPVLLTRHYQLHKKEYDREISARRYGFTPAAGLQRRILTDFGYAAYFGKADTLA